jgi:uncharacterized oligopeptide transporter (OPT) family protein
MPVSAQIVLGLLAIWLFVELGRTLIEELSQDIGTVAGKHRAYFSHERGTDRYWLQNVYAMVVTLAFSTLAGLTLPLHGLLPTVIVTMYLIISVSVLCLLATALWWRAHALRAVDPLRHKTS